MASAGCFLRRKRPSTASHRSRPSASSAPSYTHSQRTISTAILLSRVNFVVHRSHSFYLNRSIIGHFLGISALRSLVRDSKRTYGRKVRSKTNRPVKFLRCENSRPTLFPPRIPNSAFIRPKSVPPSRVSCIYGRVLLCPCYAYMDVFLK